MDKIEINAEYLLTSIDFDKWVSRARFVEPQCKETIRELKYLLNHFNHCFESHEYLVYPKYPEALCTKLRKEIEKRIKDAQDVEKAVNQLIEEGARFDVYGRDFDNLLQVMKELITLESKLSEIIFQASSYLELKDKEEQGGRNE